MVTFRYTTPPNQSIEIEPFTSTSADNLNVTSRLSLFPFLRLSSEGKIPNLVTPGGYSNRKTSGTAENFVASSSGPILTLGPGYCLMNEEMFEFKQTVYFDLRSSVYYVDNFAKALLTKKVYVLSYYNPEGTLNHVSSLRTVFSDPKFAYIVLMTDPLIFYYNQDKFCFLYCLECTVSSYYNVSDITDILYRDPTISYMRRKIYDTVTI